MELVAHHKTIRFKLLLALYIASDADCDFSMNMEKLAEQRQLDNRHFLKAFKYLLEEQFVRLCDGGGEHQAALTHKGLKVVEEVFLDAQKQTYYFPPYQKMRKQ